MSIHFDVSQFSEVNDTKGCHSMPCKIEYSGEANVSKYFESVILKKSPTGNLVKKKNWMQ